MFLAFSMIFVYIDFRIVCLICSSVCIICRIVCTVDSLNENINTKLLISKNIEEIEEKSIDGRYE